MPVFSSSSAPRASRAPSGTARAQATGASACWKNADRRPRVAWCVLNPSLLLLHLDLGGRSHANHRDAARRASSRAAWQLFLVVVRWTSRSPRGSGRCGPGSRPACPCRRSAWCCPYPLRCAGFGPRSSSLTFSSLNPSSSEITLPAVTIATSASRSLRRSPKPGALTAHTPSALRSLFTTSVASAFLHVLGDDKQRLARLHHLLEDRAGPSSSDLLLVHQDVRVL